MIKRTKVVGEKNILIARAQKAIEKHPNAIFAYLFGGLARHDLLPLSDVDIAVYLRTSGDMLHEKLELLGDLIDALGTDEVDLVILNTAPLPLIARILTCDLILLDRDPFFRHAYESLALRKYFDFSIKEEIILNGRFPLAR